ncbi:hypothetical protein SAMN05892883_0564 [Jatrophihabitans sp. GAS493]|nr:hypothetical protein SAMN05892883_0564 [Jatrophihabitans sp. GAS493]
METADRRVMVALAGRGLAVVALLAVGSTSVVRAPVVLGVVSGTGARPIPAGVAFGSALGRMTSGAAKADSSRGRPPTISSPLAVDVDVAVWPAAGGGGVGVGVRERRIATLPAGIARSGAVGAVVGCARVPDGTGSLDAPSAPLCGRVGGVGRPAGAGAFGCGGTMADSGRRWIASPGVKGTGAALPVTSVRDWGSSLAEAEAEAGAEAGARGEPRR